MADFFQLIWNNKFESLVIINFAIQVILVVLSFIPHTKTKENLYQNLNIILQAIPSFIKAAEVVYSHGNGSHKLSIVLDMINEFKKGVGTIPDFNFIEYIESILETPEKKGV